MKTDKKQLPQLIVLGLLVLACVGYVSFRLVGPKPASNATAPADAPDKQAASEGKETVAYVTEDVVALSVFPELATVPSRRDPFVQQHLPGQKTSEFTAVQNAKPRPVNIGPMPFGTVPNIGVEPINPFGGNQPETSVAPQETKFNLTGVVRGERNVAILRTSDGGRHVVKQGQLVNGRFEVLTVTDDAVVLRDGSRRIYVKLGGDQNAS